MWWNELDTYQQIFFVIALPTSVFLVIQTILLIFGIGGDDATDFDFDADAHSHDLGEGAAGLIIRGMIAFLTITGWTGFALASTEMHKGLVIVLSVLAGIVAFALMVFLIKAILKLQGSGNIDYKNSLGKTAKVYLTIPANMSGTGKININVQDRFLEIDAMTKDPEKIKTEDFVKVVEVIDSSTLLVERLNPTT